MEQHLPFSQSVLIKNTQYCKKPLKTKSTTPIHTGGGTIESHFWIELPLKLENQKIQIKLLVHDSECPYDILIGRTSLAHLSAWQEYVSNKVYLCHITFDMGFWQHLTNIQPNVGLSVILGNGYLCLARRGLDQP